MRKTTIFILTLIAIAILLRGQIFRGLISYKEISQREIHIDHKSKFIQSIVVQSKLNTDEQIDLVELAIHTQKLVSNRLNFDINGSDLSPYSTYGTNPANCVDYANFIKLHSIFSQINII